MKPQNPSPQAECALVWVRPQTVQPRVVSIGSSAPAVAWPSVRAPGQIDPGVWGDREANSGLSAAIAPTARRPGPSAAPQGRRGSRAGQADGAGTGSVGLTHAAASVSFILFQPGAPAVPVPAGCKHAASKAAGRQRAPRPLHGLGVCMTLSTVPTSWPPRASAAMAISHGPVAGG